MKSLCVAARIEWFRARAEKDRHNENVNQLHADFRHTITAYSKMSVLWTAASNRPELSRGARAYAHQKAAMFKEMESTSAAMYKKTRRDPKGEKLDYSLV